MAPATSHAKLRPDVAGGASAGSTGASPAPIQRGADHHSTATTIRLPALIQ
jgi:hypothetical protein